MQRPPKAHLLGLVLVALSAVGSSQGQKIDRPERLRVLSVFPELNALNVPRSSPIRIRFNGPVDVDSLAPENFEVFGRWSGVHTGQIELFREGRVLMFTPDAEFSAGEQVTIRISPGIDSTLLRPLQRPVTTSFRADSRMSSITFTHMSTLIPGQTPYGAYAGDINDDGHLDMCIPNEDTSDVSVFINQGGGVYGTDTRYAAGLHCSANEGGDMDGDGDIDFAVANILDDDMSFLRGNGDGTFPPQVRYATGNDPRGLTIIDCDGDGDLDIFTANRLASDCSMFLNDGSGTFASGVSVPGGVSGEINITMADVDSDGRQDLIVVGQTNDRARCLISNGDGTFTFGTSIVVGQNPWMVVAGDVDGDGDEDCAVALSVGNAVAVVPRPRHGGEQLLGRGLLALLQRRARELRDAHATARHQHGQLHAVHGLRQRRRRGPGGDR